MTAAAVLAFAVSQAFTIPLHGLWAVLTAVVVTQMSVGGSLRATTEYVTGTLGGAVYASIIGFLIPHTTPASLAGVLALTVAPLAYAATITPAFRVAPFTAVLVLLISTQLGEGPIESGLYRLFEVAVGGAIAVAVSVLVAPEREHGMALDAAARILDDFAQALPELLAGVTQQFDVAKTLRLQDELGRSVAAIQTSTTEAQRERLLNLVAEPDPAPLSRTLLRLRHDFVMIGRAATAPLPDAIARRLAAPLAQVGAAASGYLRASAQALASRSAPPSLAPLQDALQSYAAELAALRSDGLTRTLSGNELERLFALGFVLDQLQRNCADLDRRVQEWARPAAAR